MATTSPEWRRFENLVAMIKRTLAPHGADVRSPDHLKDADGSTRQVDASIRYKVGTVPVLITVECRCRGRRQQKDWLEGLPAKRDAIAQGEGVPVTTVAVSSSGFSKTAKKAARRLGIQVRSIVDVTPESLSSWLGTLDLVVSNRKPHLLGATVIAMPEEGDGDGLVLVNQELREPMFAPSRTDAISLSILGLVDRMLNAGSQLLDNVPVGTTPFDLRIGLGDEEVWVDTNNGRRRVREVVASLNVTVELKHFPIAQTVEYQSESSALVHHAQFDFELADGRPASLGFSHDVGSGETKMGLAVHTAAGLK